MPISPFTLHVQESEHASPNFEEPECYSVGPAITFVKATDYSIRLKKRFEKLCEGGNVSACFVLFVLFLTEVFSVTYR